MKSTKCCFLPISLPDLDKKKLESSCARVTGQSFSGTIFEAVTLYPCKINMQYKNPLKNSPFTSYKNPRSFKTLLDNLNSCSQEKHRNTLLFVG